MKRRFPVGAKTVGAKTEKMPPSNFGVLSQSCLLAKPAAVGINLAFLQSFGLPTAAAKPFLGFTWVGININRTMKVIANVLIRYDDNIVSKRMNGKKLSNLTNRW